MAFAIIYCRYYYEDELTELLSSEAAMMFYVTCYEFSGILVIYFAIVYAMLPYWLDDLGV